MSERSHDGGPAFPGSRMEDVSPSSAGLPLIKEVAYSGMTLRDWFAGRLIADYANVCQVMVSGGCPAGSIQEEFAKEAYRVADAMLAARASGKESA